MARVFVTREIPGRALERLRSAHETTVWPEPGPPPYEVLREHARESEGLLTLLTDRIDTDLIEGSPNLRVIANYAVGYDNVDTTAAAAHGVAVGNTPDALTEATADLAFALLMASARHLPAAAENARSGQWRTWDPQAFLGADIYGATLGIIGIGRIGHAVARRANGFGMRVLTAERHNPHDLEHLLASSDFLTLHCPLTAETYHLIDAAALALMKPTAILINTARGGIVDQIALAQALSEHRIAGAAMAVTDPEPLPIDDPLWQAPNLLIVPHIGSATRTARELMTEMAVDNILAGLAGKPLPHGIG
jgi:glyoxylate reductase